MDKESYLAKNSQSSEKFSKIAEILGILEERNKGKAWLVEEVRRHKIKIPIKQSMNSFEILRVCPEFIINNLHRALRHDDLEDFEEIKTLTKTFHWFYTDIVGSSNPAVLTKDQARRVLALNNLIGKTETFRQWNPKSDVLSITGDGMAIGFRDTPEKPLRLAIELQKIISKYNQSKSKQHKLGVRIGIDTGPVYIIKDLTGKENFWGPGIIFTKRIMDLARSGQILTSERIATDIGKLSPEYKSLMHSLGEHKTKHHETMKIFNIYGDGWGNRLSPQIFMENNSKADEPKLIYTFPKVELKLEITNPKNMMAHHTWNWNLVNMMDTPMEQVSYFLEGDVARDFSKLNAVVRDEENKKLKIIDLNVNQPYKKNFIVKLNKPLKPGQKRRYLKLEYDWEEPDRNFMYTLSTDCKKFRYVFTAPKNLNIKQRVLHVNIATRAKTHASPAAVVKYHKDKTEVIWEKRNLHAYDAYRFEW